MNNIIPLLIILLVGIGSKNNTLAAASGIVMVMGFMNLGRFYGTLERRGIELGLLFLTTSLLVPFATGKISSQHLFRTLTSTTGIFAIIGGILGAYLNAQGLSLLTVQPEIVPGILIGVVISICCFGGISVGPIMAAGFTAVLIRLFLS